MAKSPENKSPRPAAARDDHPKKGTRRSALTDFLDTAEPLERKGFGEAPQAELSGTP